MTARLRATLLAAALFVAFVVTLFVQPTGYSMLSPGPTVDILGLDGSTPIVNIKGHKSYPDNGELRMLTVLELPPGDPLSITSAIQHWLDDDTSVYPINFLYPPGTTSSSNAQEGAAEMASAQDLAKAAALRQAGFKVPEIDQVVIQSVDPKGASQGRVKVGDILVSVAGKPVTTPDQAIADVHRFRPGDTIGFVVRRAGKNISLSVKAKAAGTSGAAATTPRIGVGLAPSQQFKFPFTINITIPDSIMGPSAGMMFALTIYDKLTPGSLTKGHNIAGTGTIDQTGKVGPIGGIAQKVRAAQRDGAQLFLAPASNCDEVRRATYNHSTMRVVKVNTLSGAIKDVTAWTANPNAVLPGCS
ncbi:MAG: YlbL family protein [Marmoricola sp.]